MSTHSLDAAPFGTFSPRGWLSRAIGFTRSLPDGWLARRLIIVVRRFVIARLRGEPVDIDALGLRMRLRPRSNICEKRMLFAPASFDPEELAILQAELRDGDTFIDIGANVGVYSLFVASRTGPSARVLAVEPQPDVFERLVYNIRLNGFPTIKAVECAIADKSGEVMLFIDPKNRGESSVKLVNAGGAQPLRTAARTLMDLVQEEGFERIDAMKLDVEGAEDLVLEPYLRDAPTHLLPRLLIVEDGSEQWQSDLVSLIRAEGYRTVVRTRLNYVFRRGDPEPS